MCLEDPLFNKGTVSGSNSFSGSQPDLQVYETGSSALEAMMLGTGEPCTCLVLYQGDASDLL